ncbi:MAG: hypothetical protein WA789_10185 [Candidatus Acidiferrum sp.]
MSRASGYIFFSALACLTVLLNGCAARKSPAIPWSTAVLIRPIVLQRSAPTPDLQDPVPDLRLELPPPPAPLATRTVPARPRSVAPTPNENGRSGKIEPAQIVPNLPAGESASLQRETEESLSAAEHNLSATAGKSLNTMQSDLASKVRSFISDAREAGRAGDWARARELAQKAQVLSEQLAGSL